MVSPASANLIAVRPRASASPSNIFWIASTYLCRDPFGRPGFRFENLPVSSVYVFATLFRPFFRAMLCLLGWLSRSLDCTARGRYPPTATPLSVFKSRHWDQFQRPANVHTVASCWLGTGPHPLLPPDIQRQFLRFLCRIHTMPDVGGQPLPRWTFSSPARRCYAQERSPVCQDAYLRLHHLVGSVSCFSPRLAGAGS